MRNIVSFNDYQKMRQSIELKIKENAVTSEDADNVLNENLPKPDNYQTRLLKLIPTEVVAVYVFISGLIQGGEGSNYDILRWVVFGILFLINPFYLRYVTNVTNIRQIIICTIGFAVWVFSLGDYYQMIGHDLKFMQIVGSVVLALYTLLVPMFIREKVNEK